ncbi:riboflavin kinase, putative [Entamoeba dispar SAW760]|uniref:riboflavin kinase n=1 Tax=Entamoeba dispar (strain ATCC PRA-260 / SAW760) TaxID=370354 RepID=B0ESB1_ENTDS|nr:riboflavin kinase, putative [Entamoeba dispar SAW760]EDR22583.1 riboflavin kinase, putative [Entamoeba dispar SAW760]|eukprot:EDR22583.1 riboflavin kinase, putative [Entamoeba dispar SAW760]
MQITIKGKVVKGFQRGRTIGYRTANINPTNELEQGVYYGQVKLRGKIYHAAISVGKNPTFCLKNTVVEVHIFEQFKDEFYGEEIEVKIMKFLRGMKKVNGIDELKKMISNDCNTIENDIIPNTPLINITDF